ncbi:Metallo-hydrolase/oxidoreductase [Microstroma glucosiphilum]|uniref:Metallo-hydrolase/oxidoreductase n=1 Tax=Pseudomicrostroma glucosiphilum TaxID=1684307 RepID=A0A316UCA0_9BASI|nr:Metallo-hydrolase/oxidoreductase [Pseudomicrostroma glucosiphilum]PWN22850.1 Metallo-hydrolase/oxidoreductase [Pseudomicrostroma glucosiphilum]
MVLLRRHLRHISGEPEDYSKEKAVNPRVQQLKQATGHNDRRSSSSTKRSASLASRPVKGDDIAEIVSAFNVTLVVRSKTPMADAHDPNFDSKDLPSHHVPTLVSVANRAVRSQGNAKHRKRRMAKAKALRAAEAIKSTNAVPSAYRKSVSGKGFVQSAAAQESTPTHLPLLTYQNPWDSFRPPTLASVWRGLKWGLPADHDEGHGPNRRSQGTKAKGAEEAYMKLEAEAGKDWADVEVIPPNWGWSQDERRKMLDGPSDQEDRMLESTRPSEEDEPHQTGERKEWQDPAAEDRADHARVTWLGHATALLQLPPLADPVTIGDDKVEQAAGQQTGGVASSPVEEKKAKEILGQIPGNALDQEGDPSHVVTPKAHKGKTTPTSSGDSSSNDHTQQKDDERSASQDVSKRIDNVRNRSINILFDPVFSKRCSPSQTVGPIRFTEVPCQVEDLPPVDVILLSHDHYDHSDVDSLRRVYRQRGQAVHVFAALGNKDWLCSSVGFKSSQVSELDWWDEAYLTASGPHHDPPSSKPSQPPSASAAARGAVRIICTPAQHGSGRAPGGKDSTLWCSWVVEHIAPATAVEEQVKKAADSEGTDSGPEANFVNAAGICQRRWRVFQAGDTGLRRHGEKVTNRRSPVCPAFEEIAKRYGTPDLFLLPISIGSSLSYLRSKDPFPRRYSPFPRISESLTSSIHMDAEDAVEMFEIMTGFPAPSNGGSSSSQQGPIERDQEKSQPVSSGAGASEQPSQQDSDGGNPLALAIHFGTFVRNETQTRSDVRSLREACVRHNVAFARTREGRIPGVQKGKESKLTGEASGEETRGKFLVSHQGETVWIKI